MGELSFDSWSRRPLANGGVLLVAPDDSRHLRIRPQFVGRLTDVLRNGDRIKLVTDEGELACVATWIEQRQVFVTAVVGSDPLFCVDSVGVDVGKVVELVRRCGLGRGTSRRRMFEFEPPPAWHGIRRKHESRFMHPCCPRNRSMVVVFDARPMSASASEQFDQLLYSRMNDGRVSRVVGEPKSVTTRFGLEGRVCEVQVDAGGVSLIRRSAAFSDHRYLYQLALETAVDGQGSREVFDRVVRSIRPLPQRTDESTNTMSHWAE